MKDIDAHKTALIVIDPQNWTLAMPITPIAREVLVENAIHIAKKLREAGGTIIFTKAAFSHGYADMLKQPVDLPLKVPPGGISAADEAFDKSMLELHADIVIPKRQWSGFYGTELDLQLRRRNITTTIICGIMTNFGVESTARDAWQHNYSVIVPQDSCSSLSEEMHEFSIQRILPRVAQVGSTSEVLRACSRHGAAPIILC